MIQKTVWRKKKKTTTKQPKQPNKQPMNQKKKIARLYSLMLTHKRPGKSMSNELRNSAGDMR